MNNNDEKRKEKRIVFLGILEKLEKPTAICELRGVVGVSRPTLKVIMLECMMEGLIPINVELKQVSMGKKKMWVAFPKN